MFKGNEQIAYRDPAVLYDQGTFYLFFTYVTTEAGKVYSYTATRRSRDLKNWSPVQIITPKNQDLDFSSPGNVIKYKNEWILCLQTYPRPDYKAEQMPRFGRISRIENVNISNVEAFIPENKPDKGYEMEGPVDKELYNTLPSSIVGLPGHLITNVSLNHISIHYPGGINDKVLRIGKSDIHNVPERANNYPEFSMFGELPAWGFYLRHVQGISLKNIKLTCKNEDYRPPFVKDDVQKMVVKHILVNGIKQTIDIPAGQ